jgi:hypothetical protein
MCETIEITKPNGLQNERKEQGGTIAETPLELQKRAATTVSAATLLNFLHEIYWAHYYVVGLLMTHLKCV